MKKFLFVAVALMAAMALIGLTFAFMRSPKVEAEEASEDAPSI
jgi:hypothetical protein